MSNQETACDVNPLKGNDNILQIIDDCSKKDENYAMQKFNKFLVFSQNKDKFQIIIHVFPAIVFILRH